MFEKTISAIEIEQKACECKRRTLEALATLVKHLDHAEILNNAFATYAPHETVEYQPISGHARANARCKVGFERTGTGECVEVEVTIFRDDDSCSVVCCLENSALLHFDCEYDKPTTSERDSIAAMLYGALKVLTF